MNRLLWFISSGILLFVMLISCSQQTKNIQPIEQTFTYNISDPIITLDPLQVIYKNDLLAASLLYEGLVAYTNKYNEIKPLLAETWQIDSTNTKYTFILRKNVVFHNDKCFEKGSRRFSAEDVKYTFERLAMKNNNNPHWGLFIDKIVGLNDFYEEKCDSITGIKIIDSLHLEITLTKPYNNFLKLLAMPTASIVPKEAVKYYGNDFSNNPVGTGSFKFGYKIALKEIFLDRNNDYWQSDSSGARLPYLESFIFKNVENNSVLLPEFINGNSDLTIVQNSLKSDLEKDYEFCNNFSFYKEVQLPVVRFFGFAMEKKNTICSNIIFRKYLFENFTAIFPKTNTTENISFSNSLSPYFKMEENHTTNSKSFSSEKAVSIASSINTTAIEELEFLVEKANVKKKKEIITSRYYSNIINNRYDIFRVSMYPGLFDYEEYYSLFYSKSSKYINICQYKSDAYDSVYEKALFVSDDSEKQKLYFELEKILQKDIPFIPISYSLGAYYVIPKNLQNFEVVYGVPNFRKVKFVQVEEK